MSSLFNNINDISKKKKSRRMRILEHRIYFFLSLLAGKFSAFEQMLLTEPIFLKKAHAYLNSP